MPLQYQAIIVPAVVSGFVVLLGAAALELLQVQPGDRMGRNPNDRLGWWFVLGRVQRFKLMKLEANRLGFR